MSLSLSPERHPRPTLWSLAPVVVATGLFAGCTNLQPYRASTTPPYNQLAQPSRALPRPGEDRHYQLAFIEFDEFGDYWNADQVHDAHRMISKGDGRVPLMILFIHGWKHNASENDTNVRGFTALLEQIGQREKKFGQRVCGVYIGWRRLSATTEVVKEFSIWDRKRVAAQVAGVPLTSTVLSLANAARAANGQSVLIGHSLGARVLERTVAQAIIGQAAIKSIESQGSHEASDSTKQRKLTWNAEWPVRLVILLNSASESVYSRQLKLALSRWGDNPPAIVAITSETDWATGSVFPIAMGLERLGKPPGRNYRVKTDESVSPRPNESQEIYLRTTAGHNPFMIDRYVAPTQSPSTNAGEKPADNPFSWNLENVRWDSQSAAGFSRSFYTRPPGTNAEYPPRDQWLEWDLRMAETHTERDASLPRYPAGILPHIIGERLSGYWVVRVPDKIVHGHDGIFDLPAIDLLAAFYAACGRKPNAPLPVTLPTAIPPIKPGMQMSG